MVTSLGVLRQNDVKYLTSRGIKKKIITYVQASNSDLPFDQQDSCLVLLKPLYLKVIFVNRTNETHVGNRKYL